MQRLRCTVAYDGTDFHGFAAQVATRTVAGELTAAFEKLFGSPTELVCAGRTDAGVHALGQVIHVDVPVDVLSRYELDRLVKSLNALVGDSIVVRNMQYVSPEFHARFSARERRYRYTILHAPHDLPFRRNSHWHIADALDVQAMQDATQVIVGEHDFSTFCRRPNDEVSLVRRVKHAEWSEHTFDECNWLHFDIYGNAFCHQMVRALTGYFVAIGKGQRSMSDFAQALQVCDRSAGVALAPPQGLCLREVVY